jgi:hypothetical protein
MMLTRSLIIFENCDIKRALLCAAGVPPLRHFAGVHFAGILSVFSVEVSLLFGAAATRPAAPYLCRQPIAEKL